MTCTTLQCFKSVRPVWLSTLLAGMLLSLVFEARGATGGSGTFAYTGNLNVARYNHTATLLPSGEVLVAGGTDWVINCYTTAERYNPSTGAWTLTGSMTQPRCDHSATLLPNGEVLVSGGVNSIYDTNTATVNGAEIYNPATGTWKATGLNVSRA